jgi:hypothetical protein
MTLHPFCWGSGGILMDINFVTCQLLNWDVGAFSLSASLQNKKIALYGYVQLFMASLTLI